MGTGDAEREGTGDDVADGSRNTGGTVGVGDARWELGRVRAGAVRKDLTVTLESVDDEHEEFPSYSSSDGGIRDEDGDGGGASRLSAYGIIDSVKGKERIMPALQSAGDSWSFLERHCYLHLDACPHCIKLYIKKCLASVTRMPSSKTGVDSLGSHLARGQLRPCALSA